MARYGLDHLRQNIAAGRRRIDDDALALNIVWPEPAHRPLAREGSDGLGLRRRGGRSKPVLARHGDELLEFLLQLVGRSDAPGAPGAAHRSRALASRCAVRDARSARRGRTAAPARWRHPRQRCPVQPRPEAGLHARPTAPGRRWQGPEGDHSASKSQSHSIRLGQMLNQIMLSNTRLTSCFLRASPVYSRQEIAQLCRQYRNAPVRRR